MRLLHRTLFAGSALLLVACTTSEPVPTTFFQEDIGPILQNTCTRSATGSGCHVSDSHGNAFGNLDTSSYATVSLRRDLLDTYGPYGQPSLLIKNLVPFTVQITPFDGPSKTYGETGPITITTDIKHVGGQLLDPTQTAFQTLKQWINNGATETNTGIPPNTLVHYPCVPEDPDITIAPFNESSFQPGTIDRTSQSYKDFASSVVPYMGQVCASGNCHGTKSNELFLLCGNDPAQVDWNYFTAGQYVTQPPQSSELVRRPLAPSSGGSFHEGGIIFQSPTDPNYKAFLAWATEHGPTDFGDVSETVSPTFDFFAHRVQPFFVKKGCMMMQCHSAAMAHDYRLRGGSGGTFSFDATLKNYQLSLAQLSLESPTVDASRLVQKNLLRPELTAIPIATPLEYGADAGSPLPPVTADGGDGGAGTDATMPPRDAGAHDGSGPADAALDAPADAGARDAGAVHDASMPAAEGGTPEAGSMGGGMASGGAEGGIVTPTVSPQALGILHRGGPLFEDFGLKGASGALCDAAGYDYDKGTLDDIPAYCMIREWHRRERAARNLAPFSEIVYVKRPPPPTPDRPQDFDVFAGGGELHIVQAQLTATNGVQLGADTTVDLTKCGLPAQADLGRVAVSWDAKTIAFAARGSATDPYAIYTMQPDGTGCAKHPLNDDTPPSAPSGCATISGALIQNFDPSFAPDGRLVFASTRGNLALAQGNVDYCGPQRSPADPSKLNANLYAYDPSTQSTTQLTFLLNMERHPSFMEDGRLIFTTEKRAPGFYQLALRRENLDTGDYHPLYAQRGTIGYDQADGVVELSDKSFAAIFSQKGSLYQGGILAVFNRSVGVDFSSENAKDYVVDPTVLDPSSPSATEPAFFNHSLREPDPLASGTPGTAGHVYASPAALPGGKILVSMAPGMVDPGSWNGAYDLVVFDPLTYTQPGCTGQNGLSVCCPQLGGAQATACNEAVALGNNDICTATLASLGGACSAVMAGAPSSPPVTLIQGMGAQIIDAVPVYQRAVRGPDLPAAFVSALDEPNGHTEVTPNTSTADVTYLDVPVLASLLFQNTPTGRQVDPGLSSIDFYEDLPPTSDVTSLSSSSSFITNDAYGSVYVRRRLIGTANLASDGSTHVTLPGGVPIVLHLPATALSKKTSVPRWQREEIEFSPGETANQSFTSGFFNNLCGQCHGAISGQQIDVAVDPDILSQASVVDSRGTSPVSMDGPPSSRSQTIVGPPSSP